MLYLQWIVKLAVLPTGSPFFDPSPSDSKAASFAPYISRVGHIPSILIPLTVPCGTETAPASTYPSIYCLQISHE